MPLVDVRGFKLGGDQFNNAAQGFDVGRKIAQFGRESEVRNLLSQAQEPPTQQQSQLAEQSAGLGQDNTGIPNKEDLIRQAKQVDPLVAEKMLNSLGFTDDLKRAEASRFSAQLQNTPFDQRAAKINARAQSLQQQGRDSKDTIELLDLSEADQNKALTGVQLADLSTRERFTLSGSSEQARLRQESFDLKREDQKLRARENELRSLERKERLAKSELERKKIQDEINRKKEKSDLKQKDLKIAVQTRITDTEDAIKSIESMLEGQGLESASGFKSAFPTIPGTDAANFEAQLETLKSKIFLDKIKAMKGMGALSENEGKKLAAAAGALELSMGPELLRSEINKIKQKMEDALVKMKSRNKDILSVKASDVDVSDLDSMTVEQLNELKKSAK